MPVNNRLFSPGNIVFWITLFFILRLYNIWSPPIEISHNWRQVTGNMIARNFYEIQANILYPRLDNGGQLTGITGTEFPLLSYLHYLVSLVFGYAHWYGRLINLIGSSIGVYYFYLLVRLILPEKTARNASILLLASSWLMFSRKAMPDTFSTSIVIAGLYYAIQYLQQPRPGYLLLAAILIPLGILCKIPAGYLLPCLLPLLLSNNSSRKVKLLLYLSLIPGFTAIVFWYFYWVPYLTHHYGFAHYFMGTDMITGIKELLEEPNATLEKFYFSAMSFTGFAAFIAGIYLAIKHKATWAFTIIIPCSALFLLFMFKSGMRFHHHSYYIIPFVPVMCVIAAYALQFITNTRLQIAALIIIVGENIANQQHDFWFKQSEAYKLSLETLANQYSTPGELVAINGTMNPQQLYFTHRKGWTFSNAELTERSIDSISTLGCHLLFIDKHEGPLTFNRKVLVENADYIVYDVRLGKTVGF